MRTTKYLTLPPWSAEEIEDLRTHIYNDQKYADYKKLYRDLGGVPRWVFDKDKNYDQVIDLFKREIPKADLLEELSENANLREISVEKGGSLITYEVDAEFEAIEFTGYLIVLVNGRFRNLSNRVRIEPWTYLVLSRTPLLEAHLVLHSSHGRI